MKKLLLTLTIVAATAATMYGQGRVNFNNYASGNAVTVGALNQGASGGATGANVGANYSAQLFWALGTFTTQAAFNAAPGLTNSASAPFFGATGGSPGTDGAGLFDGGTVPIGTIADYTMQMRVWFNTGFSSYAAAVAGGRNAGTSQLFVLNAAGPPTPPGDTMVAPFTVSVVPEPSTFALAGLGAASLLLFRRRK